MTISMISLLGQSPAVVTEGVAYLYNMERRNFRDVIIISTTDKFVQAGAKFVRAALQVHYPRLRSHTVSVDFDDILNEEQNLQIMKTVYNIVRRERDEFGAREIYLNVAGGRKIMSVSVSLLGSLIGLTHILHIIHSEIHTFNELQERHRPEIEKFYELDDPIDYYRSHQDIFDQILFPKLKDIHFLNIPVIPYPPDAFSRLLRILQGVYFEEEFIEDFILERYKDAGLIVYDRYRTYPTEQGEKILSIFRDER